MTAFRFIHASDLHLGRRFANIPQPEDGNIRGRLMEARLAEQLPDVLRSAEILLDAGETGLARRVLTRESAVWLGAGLEDCRALVAAGHARLRMRDALNRHGKPQAPAQLW